MMDQQTSPKTFTVFWLFTIFLGLFSFLSFFLHGKWFVSPDSRFRTKYQSWLCSGRATVVSIVTDITVCLLHSWWLRGLECFMSRAWNVLFMIQGCGFEHLVGRRKKMSYTLEWVSFTVCRITHTDSLETRGHLLMFERVTLQGQSVLFHVAFRIHRLPFS